MYGTAMRRAEIMRIICRRRSITVAALASELGVSERTVRRDIEVLSLNEPIYTQQGRYGGGVYVDEDYIMQRMYMTQTELNVLHKLSELSANQLPCLLSADEQKTLNSIIALYSKPQTNKEK